MRNDVDEAYRVLHPTLYSKEANSVLGDNRLITTFRIRYASQLGKKNYYM
ncbi:hypothetical protein Hanom_Chr07g00650201 [Helianthus anomalus]